MPHNTGMDWIRLHKRMAIYFRDDFDCVWCGQVFPPDYRGYGLTLDHLDPGGGNEPENLVTSCKCCNSARGARSLKEWYRCLKGKGHNIRRIQRKVQRLVKKPLNLEVGRILAAARRPDYDIQTVRLSDVTAQV